MGKGKKTDLLFPEKTRRLCAFGAEPGPSNLYRSGRCRFAVGTGRQLENFFCPAAGSRVDAPCTLGLKPCPEAHARLEEKLWLVFSSRPSRNWMDHSRSTIEQHAFAGRSCDYVLRHA
jgi:hypothetical protein